MQDCVANHKRCLTKKAKDAKPPTRILDLQVYQTPSDPDKSDIRLITTSTLPVEELATLRYAVLSHSWGSDIEARLEQSRLAAYSNRIPYARVPPTHKDAIVVARQLGFRYLWIDSLCIIQDSGEDCQRETAKMGDIYTSAELTIAAVSSGSNKTPFLQTQDTTYTEPITLHARRTPRLFTTEAPNNSASWSAPQGISDAVQGPLSRRAWTLQERALASRIVHFTAAGVRFECPTKFQSEDRQKSSLSPGYCARWSELETELDDTVLKCFEECGQSPMVRESYDWVVSHRPVFWRTMLRDYTTRGITKRTDKLPALSGVAARVQALLIGLDLWECVAGLWRDRLVEDLCWITNDAKQNRAPPILADETELPSWSWASISQQPTVYPIIGERG
ncbi:heterokaryon incompatibility protein-domain-containing protein, partial [Microdochium bolleyi]